MVQDLVARFVTDELIPLESAVLAREAAGQAAKLTDAERTPLNRRCRELGLWALDAPADLGGAGLSAVVLMSIFEELGRTITPFSFPPDSPDLHMLLATANAEQREKYVRPYAAGEFQAAIAISEPNAGSDPAAMTTLAVPDGDHWVINGRKIWVSFVDQADFLIVMAVTDKVKRAHGGITAFLVEKGTPGFTVEREIKMLAGARTYELTFDNCRVHASQMLGELGSGFAPMQLRLTFRRLQMGAWAVGMARRALQIMTQYAKQRVTFGAKLADRQAVQWWIADAATRIYAARLMVRDIAAKFDRGEDARTEASMVKVFATEMAAETIDHAMQALGAMGMTKELPLQFMAQRIRLMRIFEGPSEVHRMVIARRVLRDAR